MITRLVTRVSPHDVHEYAEYLVEPFMEALWELALLDLVRVATPNWAIAMIHWLHAHHTDRPQQVRPVISHAADPMRASRYCGCCVAWNFPLDSGEHPSPRHGGNSPADCLIGVTLSDGHVPSSPSSAAKLPRQVEASRGRQRVKGTRFE